MKHLQIVKVLLLAFVIGLAPFLPSIRVHADTLGDTTPYSLPYVLSDITEGPDGYIWATATGSNPGKILKINRSTGSYTEYNTNSGGSTYDFSHITAGADGNLWAISSNYVGYITTGGASHAYHRPDSTLGSAYDITNGPDNNLWYGVSSGDLASSKIGRITTSGSYLTPFNAGGIPNVLVSDKANNVVWVAVRTLTSTGFGPSIIRKFAMDGTYTDYSVPSSVNVVSDLTLGPDGNIWFVGGGSKVGEMAPDGTFTTYSLSLSSGITVSNITSGLDENLWVTLHNSDQVIKVATDGSSTTYSLPSNSSPHGSGPIISGKDGNEWDLGYASNAPALIRVGSGYTDNDEDGLQAWQESEQGTSDINPDSDGDGLSDYTESQWNTNRDAEFCNNDSSECAYPDPITPDIYVETDWMVDSNDVSYQPSDAQLDAVQAAYANHGINFHYDNGTYGGGNEVPYNVNIDENATSGQVDIFDYMNGGDGVSAQFATARHHIWHYMLFGYDYADDPTSTGFAQVGGDDTFISYGLIREQGGSYLGYVNFDDAIEGSTIHELGHNLCLTASSSQGQSANCVFAGVDNDDPTYANYVSAMNYNYQLNTIDYSTGSNGANDHDDWGALDLPEFASVQDPGYGSGIAKVTIPTNVKTHKKLAVANDKLHLRLHILLLKSNKY